MVYIKVGEEEKAFEAAQRGLALSPDHEGAAMGLAQSALMARRPELALKPRGNILRPTPINNPSGQPWKQPRCGLWGRTKLIIS